MRRNGAGPLQAQSKLATHAFGNAPPLVRWRRLLLGDRFRLSTWAFRLGEVELGRFTLPLPPRVVARGNFVIVFLPMYANKLWRRIVWDEGRAEEEPTKQTTEHTNLL